MFTIVDFKRTNYAGYTVPIWAELLGWVIAVAEIGAVPAVALYNLYFAKGNTFRQVNLSHLSHK